MDLVADGGEHLGRAGEVRHSGCLISFNPHCSPGSGECHPPSLEQGSETEPPAS